MIVYGTGVYCEDPQFPAQPLEDPGIFWEVLVCSLQVLSASYNGTDRHLTP